MPATTTHRAAFRTYAASILVLLAILLLSLAIDLTPRFHMTDSAVYILTRYPGFIPDNRSWTYGLVAGWLLRTTRFLGSVALTQIIASWVAFTVFAFAVARRANVRSPLLLVIPFIGMFEPLGFYWSRSIMTDSSAQSALVLLFALLLLPLGTPLLFVFVFLASFALISLRVIYFPALAIASVITILWLFWVWGRNREIVASRHAALRWVAILAAIALADLGYACANTYMTRARELSTNIGDMEFLVGALSPLMGTDLEKTPLTAAEREILLPLTYDNRIGNTFSPRGLVMLIRRHFSSSESARPAMQTLVLDSIKQHPLGLAELVLRQWGDYLNPFWVVPIQHEGALTGAVLQLPNDPRVVLPNSVIRALRMWKVKPFARADLPMRPSAALTYLEVCSGIWSLILAYCATLSPLCLPLVPARHRSAPLVFITGFAFLYMATIAFGANQMVARYLLPLDVPVVFAAAFAVSSRTPKLAPYKHPVGRGTPPHETPERLGSSVRLEE